ncbi:hypothetical protein U1Q18_015391 [Sarracenia purpurea var. burkii]
MEDLSDEVAFLSQVEESISGARNKNSKSNSYMGTPVTEVCKSEAGVARTEGYPIELEVSQALGCQVAANSSGSGELPMHIDEHISVGIDDVNLDKSKCDLLKANGNSNSNGLSKTDLHQFEGFQQGPLSTCFYCFLCAAVLPNLCRYVWVLLFYCCLLLLCPLPLRIGFCYLGVLVCLFRLGARCGYGGSSGASISLTWVAWVHFAAYCAAVVL